MAAPFRPPGPIGSYPLQGGLDLFNKLFPPADPAGSGPETPYQPPSPPYPSPPGGFVPGSMVPGIGYPTTNTPPRPSSPWPSIDDGGQVTGPGGTLWPGMPVPLAPGGVPNPGATPFEQAWENIKMMLAPGTRPSDEYYRQHYPDLPVQGPGIPPDSTVGNLPWEVAEAFLTGAEHPTKQEAEDAGAGAIAWEEALNTAGNLGQGFGYYQDNWPEIIWNTATGVRPTPPPPPSIPPPMGPGMPMWPDLAQPGPPPTYQRPIPPVFGIPPKLRPGTPRPQPGRPYPPRPPTPGMYPPGTATDLSQPGLFSPR